jgi:hypothetical protein
MNNTTHISQEPPAKSDEISFHICSLDGRLSCISTRADDLRALPFLTNNVTDEIIGLVGGGGTSVRVVLPSTRGSTTWM